MNTRIPKKIPKQWVIADIHGCFRTFVQLIEQKIQPSKEDQIFLLGDYIDRGENPKAVIDYILSLRDKGYQVFPIMGNHEEILLRCYAHEQKYFRQTCFYELKANWFFHGGNTTLKSFNVHSTADIPFDYIRFFQNLDYYHETENFVLVHAGMNFNADSPFSDRHAMLWAKDYQVNPEKINHKRLIHGHVPVNLSKIKNAIEKDLAFSLDNGCIYKDSTEMGNLLALELNTLELIVQKNVEKV